jgi:hypothetical protein
MDIYVLLAGWGLFQSEYLIGLLVFLLKFNDIYLYKVRFDADSHGDMLNLLNKETVTSSIALIKSKKFPAGFFINWNSVGYINPGECYSLDGFNINIITTQKYFDYLTKRKEITVLGENQTKEIIIPQTDNICVFNRCGCYSNFYYSRLSLNLKNLIALPSQEPIVDDIISEYKRRDQLIVFIDGVPCSGKSSIGYLVAKNIGGAFCHTFNPTDPGDKFDNLIRHIRDLVVTSESPIVVVLEEVDILLNKIHNQTIRENHKIPTSVKDKSSWSSFLDDMFFYQNVILIMTSNKSKNEIDKMDPAYLRKGRVHSYFTMNSQIIR